MARARRTGFLDRIAGVAMNMRSKGWLLTGLLALGAALPASAALQEGAPAPDFTAQASLAGKPFTYSLKDALKKGPVVVYFYPSAYTGGCNVQARTFAVNKDK